MCAQEWSVTRHSHSKTWELTGCTYRLEGGNLLVAVRVKVLLRVVDGHATIDTVGQSRVLHNGHTLVGAVGVLEEHDGRPVVGKVLAECACCAAALLTDVTGHGDIEGISADDLMDVG